MKIEVNDTVWWKQEKEKVLITHINRSKCGRKTIWILSKNSGTWVVYESAIKPIISLAGMLHSS